MVAAFGCTRSPACFAFGLRKVTMIASEARIQEATLHEFASLCCMTRAVGWSVVTDCNLPMLAKTNKLN